MSLMSDILLPLETLNQSRRHCFLDRRAKYKI